MKNIYVNQVGFLPGGKKKAVLNFNSEAFKVCDKSGVEIYSGKANHFGTDEISGEDTYVADFSSVTKAGKYYIEADGEKSVFFEIGEKAYDKLMKDMLKCYYYLRCGDALSKEYAGVYYHKPCHMSKAKIYGETGEVDVTGGWHDAGDYGRYSTAGAVAVAHLLYGVRFFPDLLKEQFNIPKEGNLPDFLSEVKVELDFLMKMQREDGGVFHKVTTWMHAPFVMPEEDKEDLFVFAVSSIATADIAAVCALAYSIYRDYDREYADKLMKASLKSYEWLENNPNSLLFYNPQGSNTGQYDEAEDISNRYWAAASLYEVTGEEKYYKDVLFHKERLLEFDKEAVKKGYIGNVFTCMGWAEVAGLGSMSLILKNEKNDITEFVKNAFISEANRLIEVTKKNGFALCMKAKDFIWGSNMELGKYLMILSVANRLTGNNEYLEAVADGFDYLLGCNSMDVSYVTGNGEKAYKNPHLRPTAVDDIEEPWPGLVSGGPNVGLQDERARTLPKDLPPMRCYLDHVDCYSLNEITIYWNSPFIFALAAL